MQVIRPPFDTVLWTASGWFDVLPEHVTGWRRTPHVTFAREVLATLGRSLLGMSTPQMAARMGKTRSSVSDAINRMSRRVRKGEMLPVKGSPMRADQVLESIEAECTAQTPRTILAIDPGSIKTGLAIIKGLTAADLVAGYRSIGVEAKRPQEPGTDRTAMKAYRRIASIRDDVLDIIESTAPDCVVIEWPSGLIGTGGKKGARGSLTTYGAAAGVITEACRSAGAVVVPVTEREWTAGTSKKSRQATVAACYPTYDASADDGLDLSDAISLARWFYCRAGIIMGNRATT